MKQDDDSCTLSMALEKPGTIDHSVNYQKYGVVAYGSSLTDGCYEDGKDWILAGGSLNIQEMLKHNSAEGMNTGTAYDDLVKFDDAFFVLEGIQTGSSAGLSNMKEQFLYGAKPDGTGWDHKGLKPQEDGYDTEMMETTADGLIFFSSLEELENAGYVCVAVLWEARGLASALFEILGYETSPKYNDARGDIIQLIMLGNAEKVCRFCEGVQSGSAVDSFVSPIPSDMPGYESQVVMAAGAFTLGSSIELSADAPLREPYAVWMQGSLNFHSGKLGVMLAASKILRDEK